MFYDIEYCSWQDVLSKFIHLTYGIEDIAKSFHTDNVDLNNKVFCHMLTRTWFKVHECFSSNKLVWLIFLTIDCNDGASPIHKYTGIYNR